MFRRALSSLRNSTAHASHYDLIVLGSGPAGQKCAIDAAKRGKSVAMVDRTSWLGGVCTHTGTLPSKTLREAIISSTGFRARNMDGSGVRSLRRIDGAELVQQVQRNTQQQKDIIAYQLRRNNVDWIDGYATFEPINSTRHVLHVTGHEQRYTADYVLIAVGTAPHHAPEFDFSLEQILDSDEMATQKHLTVPRSLLVVGGGVIGMEYASMINIIPGTYVTVIDKAPSVLPFVDREMVDLLLTHFRQSGGRTILNDQVLSSRVVASTNVPQGHPKQSGKKIFPSQIAVTLRSGKTLRGDALLYCMGRRAQTDSLNLPNALGVQPNPRGHLSVNAQFQVLNQKDEVVPGLYAAGDVIGIPALASTAMEQGRRASCHMWSQDASIQNFYGAPGELFPYGIYTVPEISMVGETEEQLTRACVRYETCQAKYSELARAQLVGGGDSFVGLLKILFCPDTLRLFGVHIIGDGATEIAHIGQTVMALGGTLEYFRSTVFNYPTFAEAYRVAALAGLGKVSQYRKLK